MSSKLVKYGVILKNTTMSRDLELPVALKHEAMRRKVFLTSKTPFLKIIHSVTYPFVLPIETVRSINFSDSISICAWKPKLPFVPLDL